MAFNIESGHWLAAIVVLATFGPLIVLLSYLAHRSYKRDWQEMHAPSKRMCIVSFSQGGFRYVISTTDPSYAEDYADLPWSIAGLRDGSPLDDVKTLCYAPSYITERALLSKTPL